MNALPPVSERPPSSSDSGLPRVGDRVRRRAIGAIPSFEGVVTARWFYSGVTLSGWQFHVEAADGRRWHAHAEDLSRVRRATGAVANTTTEISHG
jgi:hypothetical protein